MKFRNKKTGQVFNGWAATDCRSIRCHDCPLSSRNNKLRQSCISFVANHPESAELIGYEAIPDEEPKSINPEGMAGLKVYIAGLISGVSNYKEYFADAAQKYEAQGAIVLNPAALPDHMKQRDYMRICLAMLECADCVVLLKGWEQSAGAKAELAWAEKLGLPVCEEG